MKKQLFGKGETIALDRKTEIIQSRQSISGENSAFKLAHGEYFYVLRKIFHTFMFDMKEFAIDFYGLPVEKYMSALLWMTYVQTVIYELDLCLEMQAGNINTNTELDIDSYHDGIKAFLQEHHLLDADIQRCLARTMQYLKIEKEEIHNNPAISHNYVYEMLNYKSADLELLRRILLKVCNLQIENVEMDFFKLVDKIREVFDDIRDYDEDLRLKNFNTVLFQRRLLGTAEKAAQSIQQYVDGECLKCLDLIKLTPVARKNKFLDIHSRLDEEKKYFFQLLSDLPEQPQY
jgi:hypothetical protein